MDQAVEIVVAPLTNSTVLVRRDVRAIYCAERRLNRAPSGQGWPVRLGMAAKAVAGAREIFAAFNQINCCVLRPGLCGENMASQNREPQDAPETHRTSLHKRAGSVNGGQQEKLHRRDSSGRVEIRNPLAGITKCCVVPRASHVPLVCATRQSEISITRLRRREKVFGPGRAAGPQNAKVRIAAYARAWSARNRQPPNTDRSPAPSSRSSRRCCGAFTAPVRPLLPKL